MRKASTSASRNCPTNRSRRPAKGCDIGDSEGLDSLYQTAPAQLGETRQSKECPALLGLFVSGPACTIRRHGPVGDESGRMRHHQATVARGRSANVAVGLASVADARAFWHRLSLGWAYQ